MKYSRSFSMNDESWDLTIKDGNCDKCEYTTCLTNDLSMDIKQFGQEI